MDTDIQFGLNYLLLCHSSGLSSGLKDIVGTVNVGPDDLNPVPFPDEEPAVVNHLLADRISETVISRLGGSGRMLAVCCIPYYFSRPMSSFPSSPAAAYMGFQVKSSRKAEASIVVATKGVIWDGSNQIVTERSTLSIPMTFRKFNRAFVDKFMDLRRYEEAFEAYGKSVNPYLLRMPELFTEESWGKACPIICAEIARRACGLMIV